MALDRDTLDLVLTTLNDFASRSIPLETRLDFDAREEFPEAIIRELLSQDIGLHLVFIPEAYGGLGGGAYDIFKVSEAMARIDLGIATALLAIALGTDPIRVGGTPAQQDRWMSRIAGEGLIVAYGVTEPSAGSHVAALKTRADRIEENGEITGYRITGNKQFITNGGVADLYTILAKTPEGPSFFVVERGTPGLEPGRTEDKHGIRASNTTEVGLDEVVVPRDHLVGLEEGQGLLQASKVFAFTRLMVAAFGLGAGEAALARAVEYSRERVQFGTTLAEKQGFTHKLLVPHSVRLTAVRAYIEEVANRIDGGEEDLATEGAVAKLYATEAGNAAAEAAIQAFGGYGYTREYEVEKIKRDVRITTIYEGTSEIQQGIIAVNRWRDAMRTKGRFYLDMGDEVAELDGGSKSVGGQAMQAALELLVATTREARTQRLTRQQFIQFQLADLMASAEIGVALCRAASREEGPDSDLLCAKARIFARETARMVAERSLVILSAGAATTAGSLAVFVGEPAYVRACTTQAGMVEDMDFVAAKLREG